MRKITILVDDMPEEKYVGLSESLAEVCASYSVDGTCDILTALDDGSQKILIRTNKDPSN